MVIHSYYDFLEFYKKLNKEIERLQADNLDLEQGVREFLHKNLEPCEIAFFETLSGVKI